MPRSSQAQRRSEKVLAWTLSLAYPEPPCLAFPVARCRCLLQPQASALAHICAAARPGYPPRPAPPPTRSKRSSRTPWRSSSASGMSASESATACYLPMEDVDFPGRQRRLRGGRDVRHFHRVCQHPPRDLFHHVQDLNGAAGIDSIGCVRGAMVVPLRTAMERDLRHAGATPDGYFSPTSRVSTKTRMGPEGSSDAGLVSTPGSCAARVHVPSLIS